MTTVFIFHGIEGHPQENWFPWLKKELESLGCRVVVPAFPSADKPILADWLAFFEQYKEMVTPETIFVGHSLGAPFILHLLKNYVVHASFLISSFMEDVPNVFNERMATFIHTPFDWPAIRKNCQHFTVMHGDHDPYLPLEKGQAVAGNLGIAMEVIPNGGHLNAAAGYTTFPLLLEHIKKTLATS